MSEPDDNPERIIGTCQDCEHVMRLGHFIGDFQVSKCVDGKKLHIRVIPTERLKSGGN